MKRYRRQFYQWKIKISKFFPKNNQLLENPYEATCPITNEILDNSEYFFKNHREVPPKKSQFSIRKKKTEKPTDCS